MSLAENVARARKAIGFSQQQLAEKIGVRQNTIAAIEKGATRRTRYLTALARALHVPVDQLDPDAAGAEADQRTVPVWGQVGAGGSVFRFHEVTGEIDRIPAPENSNERTGAVEIVGDSLGTLFDRWYAVYDEVRDPPTRDLLGKLCIVETVDGRVMIKRLTKGRGKRFTLESNYDPPIYDVEVAWAAPVKNMVPR